MLGPDTGDRREPITSATVESIVTCNRGWSMYAQRALDGP